MKNFIIVTFITLFSVQLSHAQKIKFGKVSKEELEEKFYPLDSSANAAILYKKRRTYATVLGGEINLISNYHFRIKIYKKDGFDWATKEINLYEGSHKKELASNIKAYTFNLENGNIVKTKLSKKDIFSERKNDFINVKKFTMPNLKEGSVIEFSYSINSPFFTNISDAKVQYTIPVKNQHIKISLLEWFKYNKRQKGYYPFKINETSTRNVDFDTNDKVIEILAKNTPALKEEPYVNNIENYAAALKLEVAALSAPSLGLFKTYSTNWDEVSKNINKNSSFGDQLKKTSYFKDDLNSLTENAKSINEKVINIFQFVKDKVKWDNYYSKYTSKGVKKAYKEGVGNVADINLMLVAMLREAGLNANPVLVSTRSNGIPVFPTTNGFNYVIASVNTPQGNFLLDATEKYSLPNVLPIRTLNWTGRIVKEDGSSESISLLPKRHALNNTYVSAKIDSEEGIVTGSKRSTLNNIIALNYRNKNNDIAIDELRASYEKKYNIEIDEVKVSNKTDINKPIVEVYKFESEDLAEEVGDKLYVNPLLFLGETNNPFKLDDRKYPIDYGTPWEDKISIVIEIPEGYKVESLPEKSGVVLPEKYASFKFLTSVKGNKIQIMSSVKMNSPIIPQTYYKAIKEFYKMIVEKHSEKIVLSKI